MYVVATAGHVDHGKSTLVRALTGMEPDRLAEERRRGLTIDLGYAWTRLGDDDLAFVDVPGHERFIAAMLAGLGPAPAVLFVVAADEGWRRQSSEHLAAVDALGLQHGLLVVTRSDLADPRPALDEAGDRLAQSSLGRVEAVAVSGRTGAGLDELRAALSRLVGTLPQPAEQGRVRLWVDRAFTVRGAGTVVTGTLGHGRLAVGDTLELRDAQVSVRGLQSLDREQPAVGAVARVAVNLRGVGLDAVSRGDALLSPGAWPLSQVLDISCRPTAGAVSDLPAELVCHLGTAAVPVRLRVLGDDLIRLTLARPLPVEPGDRLVLRDPGRHAVAAGAVVLDVDPPPLRRRGAAAARAADLARERTANPADRLAEQVRRRSAVKVGTLAVLGVDVTAERLVRRVGEWLVDPGRWTHWQSALKQAVNTQAKQTPLEPRISAEAARRQLDLPDRNLLPELAHDAGLRYADGRVAHPEAEGLGAAEPAIAWLENRLTDDPFAAPERPDLEAHGLGPAELAAGARVGRLIRLTPDVVLLPSGPPLAMRVLSGLPQPFTISDARRALGTTRRVAVPLLEHLDRRGWTVRVDSAHRRVRS